MGMRYAIAAALWVGWILPFIHKAGAPRQRTVVENPSARWGIALQSIAYGILWGIPVFDVPTWRIAAGLVLGAIGILANRLAIQHLGKQWRVDAALSADHALVQSGPYTVVRHPLYAGMFAMLLASGFILSQWLAFAAGIAIFVIGTEIRIRAEETLLRARFREEFEAYASRVSAYVPYVR